MSRSIPSGDLAHEKLRASVSSPGGGSVDFSDGRYALRVTRDSAYRGDGPIGVVDPYLTLLYELLSFLPCSLYREREEDLTATDTVLVNDLHRRTSACSHRVVGKLLTELRNRFDVVGFRPSQTMPPW